jgi:hypothetical protein
MYWRRASSIRNKAAGSISRPATNRSANVDLAKRSVATVPRQLAGRLTPELLGRFLDELAILGDAVRRIMQSWPGPDVGRESGKRRDKYGRAPAPAPQAARQQQHCQYGVMKSRRLIASTQGSE